MVTVKDKIVGLDLTIKDRCPSLSVLYRYHCLYHCLVTGQDTNGSGQNIVNMSVWQKYNS